jgi:hypothetical protein
VATITIPNGEFSWQETVTATGVTPSKIIILGLAPALDADENDPELLAVASLAAAAGTDQITITASFDEPANGPVKLNWSAL